MLLVIEFDQRVSLKLIDQALRLVLKGIHLRAHLVLLLQHVVAHVIERVVEDLEDVFDFELMAIKLRYKRPFLLRVNHL